MTSPDADTDTDADCPYDERRASRLAARSTHRSDGTRLTDHRHRAAREIEGEIGEREGDRERGRGRGRKREKEKERGR